MSRQSAETVNEPQYLSWLGQMAVHAKGETMTNQLSVATTVPLGSRQKMAVLFRSECHNVARLTNKNHLVAWFPKHTIKMSVSLCKSYFSLCFFALEACCCKIHQSFTRVERMCFDVLHLKVTSHRCNAAYGEVPLRSADMRSLWAEQKHDYFYGPRTR